MKRRVFIKFASVTGLLFLNKTSIAKTVPSKTLSILDEVYEIIFPKTQTMPSSKEFGALRFLIENINHERFDSYDKNLVLQGTLDFDGSFPEFLGLSKKEKTELIMDISNTNDYAQSWISKLIYYGIEAMLGDPIYGGNAKQIGWKSINHNIGYPRPKSKYGQKI